METTAQRATYRDKLEAILSPRVAELQQTLTFISFTSLITNYQMKFYFADDRSSVPDGYWAKWRYLWALAASPSIEKQRSLGRVDDSDVLVRLDDQLEDIYNVYTAASFLEEGHFPGNREEFLMRLGIAMQTRETSDLAFPEQLRAFLLLKLEPLNAKYFLPEFGITFSQLLEWVEAVTHEVQRRLNIVVEELRVLASQFKDASGADIKRVQKLVTENSLKAERIHIFTFQDLGLGLPLETVTKLVDLLSLSFDKLEDFRFPHQKNPLDSALFIKRRQGSYIVLDPARATRALDGALTQAISGGEALNALHLKSRDKALETAVAACLATVFGGQNVYQNFYVSRGQSEKDVLVLWENTAIAVECKSSRIRPPVGLPSDLFNYEDDFSKSVQYAYEQADEVKRLLTSETGHTFPDRTGKPMFTVQGGAVARVFTICVANVPRGPLGTDMSLTLDISGSDRYPLTLRYYDLQTIAKYLRTPKLFLNYLASREALHGIVTTGDELNFAGYYYKFGNLDFGRMDYLDDSFSSAFDEEWYQEQGQSFETNFDSEPAKVIMKREGKDLVLKSVRSGKTLSRQTLPQWALSKKANSSVLAKLGRQSACPCGSGKKIKRCCGSRLRSG